MPIYEYKCATCEKRLDVLQKPMERAILTCPYCKEDTLVKLFSAPAFALQGVGVYKTGMTI